jgi:2-hydroxy-6-oxonona-2,4-dienedioate hydrolase
VSSVRAAAHLRPLADNEFIYQAPAGTQPHVVLLPGLIAGEWMWRPTMDALAQRGYGYLAFVEPFAGRHGSAAPLTRLVIESMDRCDISSAIVAGGSYGSRIALDCTLAHPERVDMLVLCGAPGSITTAQLGITFQGKVTRPIAMTLLDKIFHDPGCVGERDISETIQLFKEHRRMISMLRLMKECTDYDYAAALDRIEAFVLMIWGAHDRISPCPLWERQLAPHARDGVFFRVERCGHVPMIERPAVFNALLLDYLSTRRPQDRRSDPPRRRYADRASR